MEFAFHVCNTMAETGIEAALCRLLGESQTPPVILCVGSDLAIGDSLGPIAGTLLRQSGAASRCFVYGTLRSPVTAKEIKYLREFLRQTHLGLIKLSDTPLRPGSGANKRLGEVGDVSVLGIVGERQGFSYSALNLTRLSLVFGMAQKIAGALGGYLAKRDKNAQFAV